MKALIYDIEIKKAIPNNKEPRLENIEYCEGWNDHANMGISVIGAYDYYNDRYRVFCDDNKEEFFKACDDADILVSFNGIGFDDKVIKEAWSKTDFSPRKKSYDILAEMWISSGLSETFSYPSHIGFSLDRTCEINFGTRKSGNGAIAPILWQQGKIGSVIDYCLNDIALTKQSFDHIISAGGLISPKSNTFLNMRKVYK